MPRMIPGLFYYDKIFYYDKKGENRKMNTSGEAAEQVMRMSLEGAEILIKLTGSGAKNVAVLLYSIYKEQNKTRGKERLTNMLRSGKPLKVYTAAETTSCSQASGFTVCKSNGKNGAERCKDRTANS